MSVRLTPLGTDLANARLTVHKGATPSFTVSGDHGWLYFDAPAQARSLAALIVQGADELDALTAAKPVPA